ncbi:MAG: bifunctional methylenetetrahydrofolate dehydrogenase/methenyltetrahydrofolate cyclohydrolase FolD [Chlorobiaceae bacterium]|nr:bifunctional methylenetetrahydrofolate dehydrogenase/methenyltetrahydrofolate cyclohydrolase FolD [Chlorobiaceae bacterium]MBA4308918.1 bifunctional methylenetetrahydrofolate dehydrogenase/methenyltetrahydrofolate cyclohydrolase FolD [Chlorobiaceae bacterium]
MTILDGKKISNEIKDELKKEIQELKSSGLRAPGLVAILVGENPASQVYVNSKSKACEEIGIFSEVVKLDSNITQEELELIIENYNNDFRIDGILVQLPLPKHLDENRIINKISPTKDIDGFHPISVGNLVIGNDTFFPCTPAGIQELLKRYEISTSGKHVVVVGRSNIVGKPIANILIQKKDFANSTVTVCHSASKNIEKIISLGDIVIAAIGQPNFIKENMVQENCVVIDVGINRVDDSLSKKGYKIVGDVDFENVAPKTSYITPVPGGVGPMTIAMLLKNTVKSFYISQIKK